jgi:hypothetical protein
MSLATVYLASFFARDNRGMERAVQVHAVYEGIHGRPPAIFRRYVHRMDDGQELVACVQRGCYRYMDPLNQWVGLRSEEAPSGEELRRLRREKGPRRQFP